MKNYLQILQNKETQQQCSTILWQLLGEVLEKYCHIFPKEERPNPEFLPELGVSIAFQGPFSGRLNFLLYGNISAFMVRQIFHETTPPSSAEILDAIQELAGTVCGNFLPYLAGPEAIFHLTPSLLVAFLSSPQTFAESALLSVRFCLEGGYIQVQLCLDRIE